MTSRYAPSYAPSASANMLPPSQAAMLADPSGRWGCLIPGTRSDPWTLEASYCRIYYAANKAANDWFPNLPGSESYEYPDIAAVLKKYAEGVRGGECPEYSRNPDGNSVAVNANAVVNYLAQRVPQAAKYKTAADFVRVVFWHAMELWNHDNSAVRPDVLWPGTVNANDPSDPTMATYFKTYENQLAAQRNDNIFSPINDFLKNVMFIGLAIGAVYILGPMIFSGRR